MLVSVIIPVYNTGEYIGRCLESLLNQTFKNLEVIVVNDATPDHAMTIVHEYASSDDRIKILEHQKNRGTGMARQTGYERASGDYIMFVDSDDYLPENAIENLYNHTEDDVDIVRGSSQRVTKRGLQQINMSKLSYGSDNISVYKSLLSLELPHSLCGNLFKKRLFENHAYDCFENLTNGEDAILFYQVVKNINRMKIMDDVVYYYYENTRSATRSILTEKKYHDIIFSFCYTCNVVRDIPELSRVLTQHEIKILLQMLRKNYDKKTIYRYADLPDLNTLLTWQTLSRHYSGFELLFNYMISNSKITRQTLHTLRKIKYCRAR
jgi:glycosyltransferase involved in cell wall biosynthesis